MQWSSLLLMPFTMCFIGVYLNLQLTFMLHDSNFFNFDSNQTFQASSDLTVYSLPFSLIATFFISHLWEILGRRITISLSFLLTAFVYIVFPYTAPNYLLLVIVRCIIGVTMAGPISNPLINDYVHRKY